MFLKYLFVLLLVIHIQKNWAQHFEWGLGLNDLLTRPFSLLNSKPLAECFMASIQKENERADFNRLILENSEFRRELKSVESKAISKGQKIGPKEIAEIIEKYFKAMDENKIKDEKEEVETKVRLLLLMLFGIMPQNEQTEGKKIWQEKIWEEKWQKYLKELAEQKRERPNQLGKDDLQKTKKALNEFGKKIISEGWKKLGKTRVFFFGIAKTDQQRFYELLTKCICLTGKDF